MFLEMNENELLQPIFISLQVMLVTMPVVLVLGTMISFILFSYNVKGKRILETLLLIPIVLPPTVLGFYLLVLLGRQGAIGSILEKYFSITLSFSFSAIVIATIAVSLPIYITTLLSHMREINPKLIHTSYLLGKSKYETLRFVILPLCKKGIFTGLALSFARGIGEFGATLMFAGNIPSKTGTISLAIYNFTAVGELDKAHILSLILILLSTLILYFCYGGNKNARS